jgi:hypothetical protein
MGLYRAAYDISLKDPETDEPLYRLLSSALKLYMKGYRMVSREEARVEKRSAFNPV